MKMDIDRPWQNEPSGFTITAFDFPIRGVRGPMGHWCGYVGVPPSHPLYGQEYSDNVPCPPEVMERPTDIDEVGVINLFLAAFKHKEWGDGYAPMTLVFHVHGGLTWTGFHGDERDFWWIGFDCAHAGDLIPDMFERYPELDRGCVYRTMDYTKGECLHLAEQLAAYGQASEGNRNGQVHKARHHDGD